MTDVLGRLRQIGVRIAIDDFGTKYSSLSYLTRLHIDELKIDQSFVDGLADEDSKRAIVTAILAIGSSLRMPVTAEGVETPGPARRIAPARVRNGARLLLRPAAFGRRMPRRIAPSRREEARPVGIGAINRAALSTLVLLGP